MKTHIRYSADKKRLLFDGVYIARGYLISRLQKSPLLHLYDIDDIIDALISYSDECAASVDVETLKFLDNIEHAFNTLGLYENIDAIEDGN